MLRLTKKQILSLITIVIILLSILAGLILVGQRQEVRKKAASSNMTLAIYPTTDTLSVDEEKLFELKATFSGGSSNEKLDYIRTVIVFDKNKLKIPENRYVDVSGSGFTKVFRVDGPQAGNVSGQITIEMASAAPGTGPATDKSITIAKIYFQGKEQPVTITYKRSITYPKASRSILLLPKD